MSLRGALGVTALVAAFLVAGLAISLAGAAVWKGELPGQGDDVAAAGAIIPSGPVPTVQIGGGVPAPTAAPGRDQSAPGTTPPAAQRPAAGPAVIELVVCDITVDCGESPNRTEWDAVTTCVRLRSGSDSRPLVLVVTAGQTPATGANHPSVIARSDPIRVSASLACHPVRALRGALRAGEYAMWVLDGSTPVTQLRFRLGRAP